MHGMCVTFVVVLLVFPWWFCDGVAVLLGLFFILHALRMVWTVWRSVSGSFCVESMMFDGCPASLPRYLGHPKGSGHA